MVGSDFGRLPADSYFTLDPRCVAALAEHLDLEVLTIIWEPAAGRGDMLWQLERFGAAVRATDLHAYPGADPRIRTGVDFFTVQPSARSGIDAIITNPPFDQVIPFLEHALRILPGGIVAMMVRHEWIAQTGAKDGRQRLLRSPRFWAYCPIIGRPYWQAPPHRASPRHAFGWVVFGPVGQVVTPQLWL